MKKFLSVLLSLAMLATFAFFAVASGESSDADTTQPAGAASDGGNSDTLGQYKVEIKDARLTKDYENKPAVVVTYGFTNNAEEAAAFEWTFEDVVYQNGVSLEYAYFLADGDPYNEANQSKEIKNGVTLDVEVAYVLNDATTDIEVEVSELISFSDAVVSRTFSIK